MTVDSTDSDDDTATDWAAAYVSTDSIGTANVFLSEYEILLVTEASINVFSNKDILTKSASAARPIVMNGVHKGAAGVKIAIGIAADAMLVRISLLLKTLMDASVSGRISYETCCQGQV